LPPQRTSNQPIIPHFEDNESLFRRYLQSHFQGGELDPSAIRFDEPPSFLRSAFSEPEDALHTDCADGKNVSGFGVLVMKASAAHYQERTVDNWVFTFQPMASAIARLLRSLGDRFVWSRRGTQHLNMSTRQSGFGMHSGCGLPGPSLWQFLRRDSESHFLSSEGFTRPIRLATVSALHAVTCFNTRLRRLTVPSIGSPRVPCTLQ